MGAVATSESLRLIARRLGKRGPSVRAFVFQTGGGQRHPSRRAPRCLTMAERQEISRGVAAGQGGRAAQVMPTSGRVARVGGLRVVVMASVVRVGGNRRGGQGDFGRGAVGDEPGDQAGPGDGDDGAAFVGAAGDGDHARELAQLFG
jgi:hypothetical protein